MRVLRKILKLFRKNKYYYNPRKYYYEKLLDNYSSIESYIGLVKHNDKQALLTDIDISFSNEPDFIKNPKIYTQKNYGKPNYTIVNNFPFGEITILFYRIFLGNYKAKLKLHFFQNSLIVYSYTFSYLGNDSEKKNILNVLKEKYKINKDIIPNECYIVNKKGTMITFSDNIDFTIYYIDYINSAIYDQMNNIIKGDQQLEERKIKRKKQELFKNL